TSVAAPATRTSCGPSAGPASCWRSGARPPDRRAPGGSSSDQGDRAMATEVVKVELKNEQDASGLEAAIRAGRFTADQVVAVVGKTEGNGGVNDFTRILADQAFRRVLQQHGHRSAEDIARVPMVWSGGCDGVITPHATVFARNERGGPAGQSRLVIGAAM